MTFKLAEDSVTLGYEPVASLCGMLQPVSWSYAAAVGPFVMQIPPKSCCSFMPFVAAGAASCMPAHCYTGTTMLPSHPSLAQVGMPR